MHKLRIYIDTSVIGGCFDEEFAEWSNKLFDEFIRGKKIAVISDITMAELSEAPDFIKNRIEDIPPENIEIVERIEEIEYLTSKYIEFNAISPKFIQDAIHIATATIYKVDILVSWNFKHIVNFRRIQLYNSINLMFGYPLLNIRSPREVIEDD
ncbi:MAG: PIN domain-containing protein [Candidatus Kapabacteria bacterium]|nr:PIN domain-containing protein [Candidatus Kapabacteria bacterium]